MSSLNLNLNKSRTENGISVINFQDLEAASLSGLL